MIRTVSDAILALMEICSIFAIEQVGLAGIAEQREPRGTKMIGYLPHVAKTIYSMRKR